MRIAVYEALPAGTQIDIRWSGAQALSDWPAREQFASLHVSVHRDQVPEAVKAYSLSSPQTSLLPRTPIGRGGLVRLLLQEWTLHLHQDRVNVVASEDPAIKPFIRSARELFSPLARRDAICFDETEFQINQHSSAVINRLETTSKGLEYSFQPLGNTFTSFGVFRWPDRISLTAIFEAFQQQGQFWRWNCDRLLPIVCTGSSGLFFLQGVANETTVQLIVYLPKLDLQKHLKAAQLRFDAVITKMT